MLKRYLLILSVLYLGGGSVYSQVTDILNFGGGVSPLGKDPFSSLTLLGGKFYGTTTSGGASNFGTIFSVDTNGSNYTDLWDFISPSGTNPYGSLIIVGNKLYGMACYGGAFGSGTIFSIDTNGGNYKDLWDFTYGGPNGAYPTGSLTILGGVFYGMTSFGGVNNMGCIFRIDTDGNGYTNIISFNGMAYPQGEYPRGRVTLLGSKLYGISQYGGVNDSGCIFSVDTNGNNYTDLLDFDGANGEGPLANLTLSGTKFYGMAYGGGAHNDGDIFSIDTSGVGFTDLFDFNGVNGKGPGGDLIVFGNELFGMTQFGGHGRGNIFSIDTNGSAFTARFEFDQIDGEYPYSILTPAMTSVYGMTENGGINDYGVIFRFDTNRVIPASVNNLTAMNDFINAYPNPSNGKFIITMKSDVVKGNSVIEVYNLLGEMVYSNSFTSNNSQFAIDLSPQANGFYLFRVIANNGDLTGEGKLIIQK